MITNSYHLYGILLPNGSWISEFADCTPALNAEYIDGFTAGGTLPDFRGGHGIAPLIPFTTPQLKTVLDVCGQTAYDMSAGNCDLYYQANKKLSTREVLGASKHQRLRCVQAMLYWDQITASQGGLAMISCTIVPTYDGTNPPFVPDIDQAIPGYAFADEYFGLGPVGINGSWLGGVIDNTFLLGPMTNVEASDGEDYRSTAGIEQEDTRIMPTTRNINQLGTLGVDGLPLTSWQCYWRRKKPDNPGAYADGDAKHIKFNGVNGLVTYDQTTGGVAGSGPAGGQLRIALRRTHLSSASLMALSTASAIAE